MHADIDWVIFNWTTMAACKNHMFVCIYMYINSFVKVFWNPSMQTVLSGVTHFIMLAGELNLNVVGTQCITWLYPGALYCYTSAHMYPVPYLWFVFKITHIWRAKAGAPCVLLCFVLIPVHHQDQQLPYHVQVP